MAWDGNGTFSKIHDWTDQRDAGVRIRADYHDAQDETFVDGINNCLTKNGENAATADLPMGGNKHTNVDDATARNQYASAGQIQDGELIYAAAGGSANTYTVSMSPTVTSLVTGMFFFLKIGASDTNTSTTCTLNVDSIGAKSIKRVDGSDPILGDIKGGSHHLFEYDGTNFVLHNPAKVAGLSSAAATLIDDGSIASMRSTLSAQEDVITTRGDIVRGASSGNAERLAIGTSGQYLRSDGTDIAWSGLLSSDLSGEVTVEVPLPYGYKSGLSLSNDSDADHDIAISPGACRDSANGDNLSLSSTLTKQIDATWAAGDDAGGMFTGSVGNNTWYHVFLIKKDSDGSIDAGFDTSISAANIPSGYTAYRRIGSVLTDGSANILGFTQFGDVFVWDNPPLDASNASVGNASRTLLTLSVPSGVRVLASFNTIESGTARDMRWSSPDQDDEAVSETSAPLTNFASAGYAGNWPAIVTMPTNTSSQVAIRAESTNAKVYVSTQFWREFF